VDRETRPQGDDRFEAPGSEDKPTSPLLLAELPTGVHAVVRVLRGGKGFLARVAAMGITPGVEVMVIQNYHRGPMLIEVRDTEMALGRGEALKIEVERAAVDAKG
jgi:ferrous iron transport protein A